MKHLTALLLLSLLFTLKGMAQGIIVQGAVRDAFDDTALEGAHVHILDGDSNVVARTAATVPYTTVRSGNTAHRYKDPSRGAVFECTVPKGGDYTVVASMVGYETRRTPFHVPQRYRKRLDVGDIYLIPQPSRLDEVTVTATKLKMYYNGDTLVYNADAFVLDQRNVLEDLVKMLPGVELRDGRVFANGRFVESIIISGKDVMPGNPAELMKMLPAYIVDKLKFYDRQGEESKTTGKDMLDASYVMDVCLKRDYHAAWLGNVQAGGGTEKRWEGMGFLMRFDDRQYFSVSADANNISRERESTDICTIVTPYDDRELTNRQVNFNYSYHATEKLQFKAGGFAKRQDDGQEVEEKQKLALSGGTDMYRLHGRTGDRTSRSYGGNMSFSLRPRKGWYGSLAYSFQYGKDTDNGERRTMTASRDIDMADPAWLQPDGLMEAARHPEGITNVNLEGNASSRHAYTHNAGTEWHVALGGNLLKLKAGYALRRDDGENRRQYAGRVFDEGTTTERKDLQDTRMEEARTTVVAEYPINYVENDQRLGILRPYYSFMHEDGHDDRALFLLEPRDGGGETRLVDVANSRNIRKQLDTHTWGVDWSHEMQLRNRGWLAFNAQLPVKAQGVDARLEHGTAPDRQRKRYLLFSPAIEVKWHPAADDRRGNKTELSLKGWCSQTPPDAIHLLNQTDTSDPLDTYVGNPALRKQTDMGLTLGLRHYFERRKHSAYATLGGTKTRDAIGVRSAYDAQSGLRTFMPVNTDGGHKVSVECGYNLPLTAAQTCWLNLSARSSHTRCANLTVEGGGDMGTAYMRLYDYRARANLRWNTANRKAEVSYTVTYGGNGILSATAPDDKVQDLGNHLAMTFRLPADINVSANCNVVSRFGYSMTSLNKTLVLTDAQVSKSVCKGKLELTLSAVDIFHQRQHVRFVMGAEGHTETVAKRYVPAYVLATLRYQWSYTPKKKTL